MGYFNREQFSSLEAFLEILDPFLANWPHATVPLAVETRNPRWVVPELTEVLRRHNTALTLTLQKWMPRPAEILARLDPVTGPLAYLRLIGNREAIEKLTPTFNKIVVDKSEELAECAGRSSGWLSASRSWSSRTTITRASPQTRLESSDGNSASPN